MDRRAFLKVSIAGGMVAATGAVLPAVEDEPIEVQLVDGKRPLTLVMDVFIEGEWHGMEMIGDMHGEQWWNKAPLAVPVQTTQRLPKHLPWRIPSIKGAHGKVDIEWGGRVVVPGDVLNLTDLTVALEIDVAGA